MSWPRRQREHNAKAVPYCRRQWERKANAVSYCRRQPACTTEFAIEAMSCASSDACTYSPVKHRSRENVFASTEIADENDEEDGEEEEEDGWIDDITHWEPSSATALRTVHKRLVAESCAVSRSNPTDGQSIALGGGAAHLYGPTEAVVLAAADLTAGSNNPAAERYTSELKVAFTRSLQYLRHFWMAVRKDDRAKALRMHAALRQLFDTIETQNGKLGEDERARLAPLSRHLQQEMLRTALGNLPTPGDNG